MGYMIGVDVGGTFTDFSIFDTEKRRLFHFKHSSTPEDPSRAIVNGILHIMKSERYQPQGCRLPCAWHYCCHECTNREKGCAAGACYYKGI